MQMVREFGIEERIICGAVPPDANREVGGVYQKKWSNGNANRGMGRILKARVQRKTQIERCWECFGIEGSRRGSNREVGRIIKERGQGEIQAERWGLNIKREGSRRSRGCCPKPNGGHVSS